MTSMTIDEIMTVEPECCTADTRLDEVARRMMESDCGEIPVCDDGHVPIGVVTDRDIVCRVVAAGRDPREVTAGECMSTPVVTVTPETSIDECARLMEMHQVRRLPVVDADGECCGIVAQADLARNGLRETTIGVVERVSEPSGMSAAG